MRKPKVGDKLFSLNVGNSALGCDHKLTPVTVRKVGRKYFTVYKDNYIDSPQMDTQYHIDSWGEKTEYSANSVLYETEKEWHDEHEISVISTQIHSHFSYGRCHVKISIEDARKIKSILDKYNETK